MSCQCLVHILSMSCHCRHEWLVKVLSMSCQCLVIADMNGLSRSCPCLVNVLSSPECTHLMTRHIDSHVSMSCQCTYLMTRHIDNINARFLCPVLVLSMPCQCLFHALPVHTSSALLMPHTFDKTHLRLPQVLQPIYFSSSLIQSTPRPLACITNLIIMFGLLVFPLISANLQNPFSVFHAHHLISGCWYLPMWCSRTRLHFLIHFQSSVLFLRPVGGKADWS